jgi:hypothetical protein
MQTAAAVWLGAAPAPRFLFEERARADGRSALLAVLVSALVHVPFMGLAGLYAPPAADESRGRDVTELLAALAEEERIVPVELEKLGAPGPSDTRTGPAPGLARLVENDAARGEVSTEAPRARLTRGEGASVEFADRVAAPEGAARPGGGGETGLSPEETRAMLARWFPWYRQALRRRIEAAYPRARLVGRGVRGWLAFRLELAPDGAVKSVAVTRADSPAMSRALEDTLASVGRFPGYEATGLDFFPPFVFRIRHAPDEWRSPVGRETRARPPAPRADDLASAPR